MHRYYADHKPPLRAALDSVSAFTEAVNRSLKMGVNRGGHISVLFRTDVFRFLFKDKETICEHGCGLFFELEHFSSEFFPAGWYKVHWVMAVKSSFQCSFIAI